MKEHIYVTHEMIISTKKVYTVRKFKNCERDFETISSFRKSELGHYVVVTGTVRLHGYKIDGEGPNSGFYDVFNHKLYTKKEIENATIIEKESTYLEDNSIIARILKR